MVHMSYVPRRHGGPESTRTSHRVASMDFGSEVGVTARGTEEGVCRGAAHVEDAGAVPSATRRARCGNGGVRLRGRPPDRAALWHRLLRVDPLGTVHGQAGGV